MPELVAEQGGQPEQTPVIHLVDDDDDLRHALKQGLELEGFEVVDFAGADHCLSQLNQSTYGVLVSDILMPGLNGLDFLKAVMEIDSALPVILITGHGSVPLAVEAIQAGAYDFLEKPFSVQRLEDIINRAVEKRRLVLENRSLRGLLEGDQLFQRIVGRSPAIVALRDQIEAVQDADVDVLIVGETGSGKEVVARALHDFSHRCRAPFVAINCAALPADIIESELFGHESGAFTGATKRRIGKLEYAQGGCVFLDEIESMPLDLQAKILRAVEERSIERLGSNATIALDVRFIGATKTDLEELSNQGNFRLDLVYRLNVMTIEIPPLRERTEDIPLLFFHLARNARAKYRREIPEFTPELEAQLIHHHWPGNVRELRNFAERFVLGLWQGFTDPGASQLQSGDLASRLAAFERSVIEQVLRKHHGSMKRTYEELGLSRKGLYDKIKRLNIVGTGAE